MEGQVDPRVVEALQAAGVPTQNIEPAKLAEPVETPTPVPLRMPSANEQALADAATPKAPAAESASEEGTEGEESTEGKAAPQYVTLEQLHQVMEAGFRRIQSSTDKAVSTATAKNQQQLQSILDQLEDAKEEQRIAALPPEEQILARVARLEKARKSPPVVPQTNEEATPQVGVPVTPLRDMLEVALGRLGIDPKDARIDWADKVGDYQTGMQRWGSSIKKILDEQGQVAAQKAKAKSGHYKAGNSGASGSTSKEVDKLSPSEKIQLGLQQSTRK